MEALVGKTDCNGLQHHSEFFLPTCGPGRDFRSMAPPTDASQVPAILTTNGQTRLLPLILSVCLYSLTPIIEEKVFFVFSCYPLDPLRPSPSVGVLAGEYQHSTHLARAATHRISLLPIPHILEPFPSTCLLRMKFPTIKYVISSFSFFIPSSSLIPSTSKPVSIGQPSNSGKEICHL